MAVIRSLDRASAPLLLLSYMKKEMAAISAMTNATPITGRPRLITIRHRDSPTADRGATITDLRAARAGFTIREADGSGRFIRPPDYNIRTPTVDLPR